jgi:hypothetical protein
MKQISGALEAVWAGNFIEAATAALVPSLIASRRVIMLRDGTQNAANKEELKQNAIQFPGWRCLR